MTATGDGPTPETWITGRREAVAVAVLVGVEEDVAVGVSVAELVSEAVGVDVDDAVGVSVVVLVVVEVLVGEAEGVTVLVGEAVVVGVLVLVWLAVAVGSGVTEVSRTVIVPVAPMTPLIAYAYVPETENCNRREDCAGIGPVVHAPLTAATS